jgi:hypothetical protein
VINAQLEGAIQDLLLLFVQQLKANGTIEALEVLHDTLSELEKTSAERMKFFSGNKDLSRTENKTYIPLKPSEEESEINRLIRRMYESQQQYPNDTSEWITDVVSENGPPDTASKALMATKLFALVPMLKNEDYPAKDESCILDLSHTAMYPNELGNWVQSTIEKFAGAKKAEMKKTATEKWKRIQAIIVARSALLQANVNTLMKDYERFLNKIYPETTNETTAIAARNRHKLRYGKSLITNDRDDQEGTNSDNEEDIQDNDQIDEQSGEVGTLYRETIRSQKYFNQNQRNDIALG